MNTETLVCPHCKYENIVLTCGFCLQCGEDLSDVAPDLKPLSSSSSPSYLDSSASARVMSTARSLSRLIVEAAATLDASCTESDRGWRLTINVDNGRKQTVHVLQGETKESSEQIVAFLSMCGPASSDLAMTLLEWNARLTNCAFAIRTINGEKMTVLTANLPVSLLDESICYGNVANNR